MNVLYTKTDDQYYEENSENIQFNTLDNEDEGDDYDDEYEQS